jgi:adenylate cyclase
MDAASEKFLANNVDAIQGAPGLVIANFRPEYRADWMSKSYYRQIALVPLPAEAIEEMLGDLLGSDTSLNQLPTLIRERTGGNPFFIEEVVQALVEAGNLEGDRGAYRLVRPVEASAVPASVEAVLAARIDRLAPREKAVLHAAAVIGKEFAEPVLARVVDLDRSELEDALRVLLAGEFVFEQELYPEAVYAFKHPLTQEVAYSSQLSARRAPVHAAAAAAISELYPDRLNERAALLAGHWEAAGEKLAAARCHAQAAAWSGTTEPNESSRHWRRVKELAGDLPDSEETIALGITARLFALQFAWRLGISHEEAEQVFTEAERMATKAGDIRSRALLLSVFGLIRGSNDGDLQAFITLARQATALAEEAGDPALYLTVGPAFAYALFNAGNYHEAAAILDRALELADGDVTIGAGGVLGCPYANALIFRGGYLLYLGELAHGRDLIEQGIKVAREQGDIEVVGWGHMWRTFLCWASGEPEAALGHAQHTLEIAERIGDSFSRAMAWFFLGMAEEIRGESQEAIEAIERSQAIARERRTAAENESWRLVRLAEAHLALGDRDRARSLVEEGVDLARSSGQAAVEAFGCLTLARVLLASDRRAPQAEIETALDRALQLASTMDAKLVVPMIHVERAELARLSGDDEGREHELRDAHRLYTEMGATGHAERLAGELSTIAS